MQKTLLRFPKSKPPSRQFVMLRPKAQLNLRNAKEYFREHLCVGDYYSQGQKVAGEWFGLGAEKLGLKGIVAEKDFVRLCEGLHPATGRRLTLRRNTDRRENGQRVANRRVFYDFTIGPPKSVSIVALLQDARIVQVHEGAVRIAMTELERLAEGRVRKAGASGARTTGNLVGACFRHETSRELDPHLHTHCILLNATFDPVERCWKALEAGRLFRAQKLAENCYFHELARGLRQLGYEIEVNARNFEIKGVSRSLIERFSKRHEQIEAETKRRLARGETRTNVKDLRDRVARDVRKLKAADSTADRLRGAWQEELSVAERADLRRLTTAKSVASPALHPVEVIAWAEEHLFERHSVVEDFELLSAALVRARGAEVETPALRAALAQRDYIREAEGTRLTSKAALRCELEIVLAARDGRGRHAPLAPDYSPARALAVEQETAVRQILNSRDFITLFRGGAGTGKSFALREVARGLGSAGRPVVVLAPQRQQVHALGEDGLPAQTVAHALAAKTLPRGAVVIVDEAGQIGGRDLRALVRLTKAHGGRLLLSGDTQQHGAVAASDALRAIEAYGEIHPAEIATIRRQDPARGGTFREKTAIARYRAAVKAAAAGALLDSFDRLDRLGWVRERSEGSRRDDLAAEYLAAVGRRENALVVAQTWAEVRAVNEAIRAQLVGNGQLRRGTHVTAFQMVDTTTAQRRDPGAYVPGQSVYFVQRYGRFAKGDCCEIVRATERGITVTKEGRRSTISYRYAERFALAAPVSLALAAGDRLQLKFNSRSIEGRALTNGELVTVRAIRRSGAIVVEDERGVRKTLAPSQRLFNRGYAVTSYASQGKTVDTVLFSDAGCRAATNRQQWYVTISRGRKRVIVFTGDKSALRAQVERLGERPLALDLKAAPPPASAARQRAGWRARARAVIATLQRINFLHRCRAGVRHAGSRIKP